MLNAIPGILLSFFLERLNMTYFNVIYFGINKRTKAEEDVNIDSDEEADFSKMDLVII